jgi:hypothetical protein
VIERVRYGAAGFIVVAASAAAVALGSWTSTVVALMGCGYLCFSEVVSTTKSRKEKEVVGRIDEIERKLTAVQNKMGVRF